MSKGVMFESPKAVQAKISLGVFLVWIGIISTAAGSFLYWGVTSQVFSAEYMEKQGWETSAALYGVLLTAFVIEAYKKAVLGSFQHRQMWYWLVFASVLTSVGGTMILSDERQDTLNKGSEAYSDSLQEKRDAVKEKAKFAHCSGYDISSLSDELTANENARFKGAKSERISYVKYKRVDKDVRGRITCKNQYDAAAATVLGASVAMESGGNGGRSANPLMQSIGRMIGILENSLVLGFYILITVLIEAVTYFIGGEVQRMKREKSLTQNQLLAIRVNEMTGIDLVQIQSDVADSSMDSEMEYQLSQKRKKLTYAIKEQEMLQELEAQKAIVTAAGQSNGGISVSTHSVNALINDPNARANLAKDFGVNGSDLDLEGYTLDQLIQRRADYAKAQEGQRLCPACHDQVPNIKGQFYCPDGHQGEFNKYLKRAKRAESK